VAIHIQDKSVWEKVEDGKWFNWTFIDVFLMHKRTVIEMIKRKLKHLVPINILDNIVFIDSKKELVDVINYIKKK